MSAREATPATTRGDESFKRRVCAVLLADVTGFSALMGIDDEGTARAVRQLQTVLQDIVADAQGHADAFAGDAIFAIFDSVVAAVDAGLRIQRRIAAQEFFEGRRLQVRMGVHLGDVLLREGAPISTAVGDAINIAARLQALARPGTICVSEGVYRQVRNRFDETFVDVGRQQLKNISDTVHAYLIVPHELAATPRRRGRRLALAAAALAVLALGGFAASGYWSRAMDTLAAWRRGGGPTAPRAGVPGPSAAQREPVALGVMLYRSRSPDGEKDWRREALRDGLNAQLSQLSQVKVYSKEFIDFLMTRKGLTDVEAASQLGIKKMLSGSFAVVGQTIHIETHVVDVGTGVLEVSYTTAGPEAAFLDLENQVVLGVISRLNLPVSEEERQLLVTRRSTNVEALEMLLEAERGVAPVAKPPTPAARRGEPRSALDRVLAWSLGPAVATADDAEAAILAVLEQYRQATEARAVEALAALYLDFTPDQQAAQERYFENVRDLRVTVEQIEVRIVGEEAVAMYTRTDDFVDARTGRPMHVTVRLTKLLRKTDGAWKLAGGK